MNIFQKIIIEMQEFGTFPKKKSNPVNNITSNVQEESDSIVSLRKELQDPTLSPAETAIAKAMLIMRLRKPK